MEGKGCGIWPVSGPAARGRKENSCLPPSKVLNLNLQIFYPRNQADLLHFPIRVAKDGMAQTKDGAILQISYETLGQEMHSLGQRLFPICRSITGPGFLQTLDILEEVTGPMQRHRFATGSKVFDWTVPKEWAIRDAWIKNDRGEKVIDFKKSNLHVVSYSTPVHETMSLETLQQYLHSLPDQPTAIPYLTSYYKERWGFCLSQNQRDALKPGNYEVFIDSELKAGHVTLGEIFIPGESKQEILFSTYCCHPSMANNELSGPLICSSLISRLKDREKKTRYSYRFLFLPETIGSIAYLSQFGANLKENLLAGYVVTCVGDPGSFTYKRSRKGNSYADLVAIHALSQSQIEHQVIDYFPPGSDERQYCSLGFDLPVGSLMRSMFSKYPQYHTSLDDLSYVTAEALGGSLRMYERIIETIESDRSYAVTIAHCEPQLGPRGLYPSLGSQRSNEQKIWDITALINYCDGANRLIDIGNHVRRPVWELAPVAEELVEHDLLKRLL